MNRICYWPRNIVSPLQQQHSPQDPPCNATDLMQLACRWKGLNRNLIGLEACGSTSKFPSIDQSHADCNERSSASILWFRGGDTKAHGSIASRNTDVTGSTRIWVIIASVTGVLALGACIAVVAVSLSRRRLRKQLLQEARQRDPCLGEKDLLNKRRKGRDVLDFEAESQRHAMIQKSLARRTGRSTSSNSQLISDATSVDDRPDSRLTLEDRLRDEEDFERSITRSRSGTGLSDKSWEGGFSARSKSPFPDPPARTWSRSSSPSSRRTDLPPSLEQHPLFRSMTDDLDPDSERTTISKSFQSTKPASRTTSLKPSADRQVLSERVNHSLISPKDDAKRAPPEMATMMGPPQEEDEYKDAALSNILMCPDCQENPPNLTEEFSSGDVVCTSCGVVVGDRIVDTRSEWRTFANDDQNNDDPSRVGDVGNPLFEDAVATLQTSIGREGSNSFHLMKTQAKGVEKGAVQIKEGFSKIRNLTDTLQVGNTVRDYAMHILKLADEKKFLKGKPQDAVIAGAIFIACRQNNVPRTFREVYNLTKVSKKEIGRVFKALEKWLQDLRNKGEESLLNISQVRNYDQKGSTGADDLVRRYVSQLAIRNQSDVENVGIYIAKKTSQVSTLAGRSPLSVAAACIFMAAHFLGEPVSSKKIAAVAGVSDGTIKTAYRYLYTAKEELLDQEAMQKSKGKGKMDRLPAN
ncbi:transcription initiation factor IIB [Gnomoniopsis smithogilvyi]|uniref:Transcription initiation factor IIB n=1 Tax=Gnomoniopsis smithogilvyi TaxID=1191159 RepID=A0A9W8YJ90_9PEZI|nr:transcription initiation factor IIB [Gnomoniopsis smithogilvyi]